MSETQKRTLGKSGITISPMGLGCWAIGGKFYRGEFSIGYGEADDNRSIKAIKRAVELGINFFDTADAYGTGHSEKVLGRALKDIRNKVVIATKFGTTFDESSHQLTGFDGSLDYIRKACEDSLERLQTDYIDLYQFHVGSYDVEKAPAVRDLLEDLIKQGKIRSYGWSTDLVDRARIFAEGDNCVAVQHLMNVLDDAKEMVAFCEEKNLLSVNRTPLAMGLLTGKYKKDSELPDDEVRGIKGPEWVPYFKKGKPDAGWYEKLEAVRDILTTGGRTLVQGALAWLWARSDLTVPIPGFKTIKQVEENCGAIAFGPLDKNSLGQIDDILGR